MYGLNENELKVLRGLNTPMKIQDFLDKIPINFEENGETLYSPRMVLKNKKAHCIEAALLAAAALRLQGQRPLIIDLKTTEDDFYHVICAFKKDNHWGAISKTNHAVLRYREPVYKNIRELVMSFFHEYFDNKTRKKNLRSYALFDMSKLDHLNWMASDEDVWFVEDSLEQAKHVSIINRRQISSLRRADKVETAAGKIIEWKAGKSKS